MSGEILNIRREMAYIRHQNDCIMQALKINACKCQDCQTMTNDVLAAIKPQQIAVDAEVFLPERNKEKILTTEAFSCSTPRKGKKTCSAIVKSENVNLFDDLLRMNRSNVSFSENPTDNGVNASGMIQKHDKDNSANMLGESAICTSPSCNGIAAALSPTEKTLKEENSTSTKRRKERRNYTEEEKHEIFNSFVEKGIAETAKIFCTSPVSVSNLVYRYRLKMKKGVQLRSLKKRNVLNGVKAIKKFTGIRRRRSVRKVKNDNDYAVEPNEDLSESTEMKLNTPKENFFRKKSAAMTNKGERCVLIKKELNDDSYGDRNGRRHYSNEEKKAMYNYYLTHGRTQTMKRFNLSSNGFSYVMYNPYNKTLRQGVQRLSGAIYKRWNRKPKLEQSDDQSDQKLQFDDEKVDDSQENSSLVLPNEIKVKSEELKSNETTENVNLLSTLIKRPTFRPTKKKILTDEQEEQLHKVLHALEAQGTPITTSLLTYTATQIIKRSSNTPSDKTQFSYSYSVLALKRYRAKKF